ncbi:MAG: 1-(5-phosphoribosyl)-5-((5-phosphoribosylamino)methylideneamino)imidazole-4-carboxamide isomerase [Bermanella sp.]|nr:1-(5-phosphoribosyl)-5-((5-phosphoribosylamino)methylideneamino)imidazole-4-carboxamide isomerase [Bermanella sp.]|tara:strand:+ start:126 stop:512 length:387 start_codon:yes stop_codon:yes gene_type:complete
MNQPSIPSVIKFHKQSQQLELAWGEQPVLLSAEFLRVLSPSAEVRGHGSGNEVLQFGKKDVRILKLEPVGNYALKITFDDGHDSGLYNWPYLQDISTQQDRLWQDYLNKLASAGKSRDSGVIQFKSVD